MGTKRSPEEFRREAVEYWRAPDWPRCRVAELLGISDGTPVAWIREFDRDYEPGALTATRGAELVRSELRTILFDYIEVVYNRASHQARLEHQTPAEAYAKSAA